MQDLYAHYQQCRAERDEYTPLWYSISRYVGIKTDINYIYDGQQKTKSRQLDEYADDPTAAISVTQAADYLLGIMWGTGSDVLDLEPSREVEELTAPSVVSKYYQFVTEVLLEQMNHSDAGLGTALREYTTDQTAFGTSGIGAYRNKQFGIDDNAIVFKEAGVDSICIDEGKNGLPEYVFVTYHWDAVRLVSEFCCDEAGVNTDMLGRMPDKVKNAWNTKDGKKQFQVVFAVRPRENYDPKKKGKLGTRYKGVWFFAEDKTAKPFYEEDFATKPLPVARAIKVRGEKFGRSSGTMLISSIRMVNFVIMQAIEVVEKLARPSLGVFGDALFGDAVLDTSPDGLTVFNPEFAGGKGGSPVFPFADVGDVTPLLNFLIPYFNEKLATAFKIDVLLDFSSAKQMTATESLQRFAIRGKSLAGLLGQQKTELLEPLVHRCVEILMDAKLLGANPEIEKEKAQQFVEQKRGERVIPAQVLQVMKEGKRWYKIRWKNELEQLTATRAVENMLQYLQGAGAMAQFFPQIISAINWWDLLDNFRESLNIPADMMISKEDFMAQIEQDKAAAQAALASQLGGQEAAAQKDMAQADKARAESAR